MKRFLKFFAIILGMLSSVIAFSLLSERCEEGRAAVVYAESDKIYDQQRMNIFLSNMAESHFDTYDPDNVDVQGMVEYALLWSKINHDDYIERKTEDGTAYETISMTNINIVLDRYFGLKLTDEQLTYGVTNRYGEMYKDGYYYSPASDGESYNCLAIVDSAEYTDEGYYHVYFSIYQLDLDTYYDNGETIADKYYAMDAETAKNTSELEYLSSKEAILKDNTYNGKPTYQAVSYNLNYGNQVTTTETTTIEETTTEIEKGNDKTYSTESQDDDDDDDEGGTDTKKIMIIILIIIISVALITMVVFLVLYLRK